MSLNTNNSNKIEEFFHTPFDFSKGKSLEQHIYDAIGSILISESDRAKIILKLSFMSADSQTNAYYVGTHPVRKIVTKFMQMMRLCDCSKTMIWMNHLQSDNDYRENLIRAYRMSGSGPDAENWKTCAFRFWRMPLGLKSRCVPSAVILPSKKIMYENAELDLFAESNKFFYSNSSYRRNRYGLPAFCMWIDMEKFTDCILQGPPNG